MRPLFALSGVLFVLAQIGSAPAQHGQIEARKAARAEAQAVPLMFYVAKGEPGACGPGCSEWIAAEGAFDRKAAERFRDFLDRVGRRKLPIFFHSQGGSMGNALRIGRILRARQMTAGVARTVPSGCDPKLTREAACDAQKSSGRELTAELRTYRAYCNSACVYALIGASDRQVAPGALLGVHAVVPGELVDGLVVRRKGDAVTPQQEEQLRINKIRYAEYVVDMGIDRGLFEAGEAYQRDDVRFLSRTEIARFGIDRRDFAESRWLADEARNVAVKHISLARAGEARLHHVARLALACGPAGEIQVQLGRELEDAKGARDAVALSTSAGDLVFPPTNKTRVGYNEITVEARMARATPDFLAAIAKADSITLLEAPDAQAAGSARRVKISTLGLAPALTGLVGRCRVANRAEDKGADQSSNSD